MGEEAIDRLALDRLFATALEAAVARIEKDGSFQPLLFELRAGGAVQAVAVLDSGSVAGDEAVIARLVEVLRPRAADGTITGAAIVIHHADERAIELRLRAPSHAADITALYALETRGVLRRQRKVTVERLIPGPASDEVFT